MFLFPTLFLSSLPLAVIGSVVFPSRAAAHPSTVVNGSAGSIDDTPARPLTIRVTSTISWQGKVLGRHHRRSRKILFMITRRFVRDRRCRRSLCAYDRLYRAAADGAPQTFCRMTFPRANEFSAVPYNFFDSHHTHTTSINFYIRLGTRRRRRNCYYRGYRYSYICACVNIYIIHIICIYIALYVYCE